MRRHEAQPRRVRERRPAFLLERAVGAKREVHHVVHVAVRAGEGMAVVVKVVVIHCGHNRRERRRTGHQAYTG